jgi:hypothetical protein
MANIKGITPTRQDFPEVRDKIVDNVELSADSDYYGITISFRDKTTLTFAVEPCALTFPVYSQWTKGEEKPLREYEPVHSKSQRL